MVYVWEQFKQNGEELTIEYPANPNGNDLSELLNDSIRALLSSTAVGTLQTIDDGDWEAVFGEVESNGEHRAEAIKRIAVAAPAPTKPWVNG